jgi:anti-anti-sigma factor
MSQVTFLDSSGLGMLIALQRRADLKDGAVRIVNPHARVMSVLQLTGLHGLLIDPDTPTAAELIRRARTDTIPDN